MEIMETLNNDKNNNDIRIFKLDKHKLLRAVINVCPVKQNKRQRKKLFNIYNYVGRMLIVVVI